MAGDPSRCHFRWLLDTDLKGWIPRNIIDAALSGAQLDYIGHLRKYASELKASGRVDDFLAKMESAGCASLNSTVASVHEEPQGKKTTMQPPQRR